MRGLEVNPRHRPRARRQLRNDGAVHAVEPHAVCGAFRVVAAASAAQQYSPQLWPRAHHHASLCFLAHPRASRASAASRGHARSSVPNVAAASSAPRTTRCSGAASARMAGRARARPSPGARGRVAGARPSPGGWCDARCAALGRRRGRESAAQVVHSTPATDGNWWDRPVRPATMTAYGVRRGPGRRPAGAITKPPAGPGRPRRPGVWRCVLMRPPCMWWGSPPRCLPGFRSQGAADGGSRRSSTSP